MVLILLLNGALFHNLKHRCWIHEFTGWLLTSSLLAVITSVPTVIMIFFIIIIYSLSILYLLKLLFYSILILSI